MDIAGKKLRKKDILPIEILISNNRYDEALNDIKKLQIKHPQDAYLFLMQGICLLNLNHETKNAILPLSRAKEQFGLYSSKNDNAIKANFHLAQAYHLNYEFDKALNLFEQLKDTVPPKREKIHQLLKQHISYCHSATKLKQAPVDFRITNLGQAINSENDEHSPVISGDENLLMFTSNKHGLGKETTRNTVFSEDIYTSIWRDGKWLPAKNAGKTVNTNEYDATCSLSSDGQTMIMYRNDNNGDLYLSHLKNDKWSQPEKLPKPINTSYEESHASFSLDGNTLLFVSDRPDGMGGKDIFVTNKLPNGTWSKAMLLGENINTTKNEESPFLSHDGQTLFFASEGHNSMGGYDIFKSEKDSTGQWSKAMNIGYPINTPGDDLFFLPTLDGQRVYFASERSGGFGGSDIYIIEFPASDERSLAVISGFLFTESGQPSVSSKITITSTDSNEYIGTYKPQASSGKYTMILPTGVSYTMTIDTPGMVSQSKEIEIPYRSNYKTRASATYLDPVLIKKQ